MPELLARDVAAAAEALRGLELYKPPGVAETIDWAEALATLGRTRLDEAAVDATLGTILKYREDQERVRAHGLAELVRTADGPRCLRRSARRRRAERMAVAFARVLRRAGLEVPVGATLTFARGARLRRARRPRRACTGPAGRRW